RLRIQSCQLRKPRRRAFPRIGLFAVRALRVILQDADRFRHVPMLDQLSNVRLHVLRRDAPRLVREQHFPLRRFGHARPEHPVQGLPVRLHQDSCLRHLVFVLSQDLSQVLDLLVHAVQHLSHRIHFHFASLKSLHREAYGQVFRQFQQYRLVQFLVFSLLRDSRQCLPQRVLRPRRHLRNLRLKFHRRARRIFTRPQFSKCRQRLQDPEHFFIIRRSGSIPAARALARPAPDSKASAAHPAACSRSNASPDPSHSRHAVSYSRGAAYSRSTTISPPSPSPISSPCPTTTPNPRSPTARAAACPTPWSSSRPSSTPRSCTRPGTRPSASLRPLSRRDQFQQLLGIVQHPCELRLVIPHGSGRDLRRHARILQARIRGHEANLVHTDAPRIRNCLFQLLC